MTPLPTARTAHARRALSARWFTAPLVALALLGSGAGPSSAAPAADADQQSYVQSEADPAFTGPAFTGPAFTEPAFTDPAFTDPAARRDELPPYDAGEAQQAVDDMVMDEQEGAEEGAREDGKGRHCPPADDDGKGGIDGQGGVDGQGGLGRQGTYERWGPHRDEAYPAEGGGDGQDAPAPSGDDPRGPQDSQDPQDPRIVG